MSRKPDPDRREATKAERDAYRIKNKKWLRHRCKVTQDSECWVWKGVVTKGGQPQVRLTLAPKASATMLVRRLVAKYNGVELTDDMQCAVLPTCLRGCCRPEHVVARSKKEAMAHRVGVPLTEEHKNNISKARSVVHVGVIEEILTSPEPAKHVALRNGLCESYASKIRRGAMRHRDLAEIKPKVKKARAIRLSPTNMFSGLVR